MTPTGVWSVSYTPWVFPSVEAPHNPDGSGTVWHGISRQLQWHRDEPADVEFLLLRGDLTGAIITLVDDAACRIILDQVPAWLYAVREAPVRCEANEQIVVFDWPQDQPITQRLPTITVSRAWSLSLTWNRLKSQTDPVEAVLLCRRWTEAELRKAQGR